MQLMNAVYKPYDAVVASLLKEGAIGILPTDTIYGIVANAFDEVAVQHVYDAKGRSPEKPCIILVDSPETITGFGVPIEQIGIVSHYWPAPLSVIFWGIGDEFAYLHRGTNSLSFRVPANEALRKFLARSGPIIAPSANKEGHPTAETIDESIEVFGDEADFYMDGGKLQGEPSTLVRIEADGKPHLLRQGRFTLS